MREAAEPAATEGEDEEAEPGDPGEHRSGKHQGGVGDDHGQVGMTDGTKKGAGTPVRRPGPSERFEAG